MITTLDYMDPRYRTLNNGFDGVVYIAAGRHAGTGTLLYDGRAVLTAAHVVEGERNIDVSFLINGDTITRTVSRIQLHPDADTDAANNDLALLWLDSAPLAAQRSQLYRSSDELRQVFTAAGFGEYGTGMTGAVLSGQRDLRLKVNNTFDAYGETLNTRLNDLIAWTPSPGTQLLADFDNGYRQADAFGQLMSI